MTRRRIAIGGQPITETHARVAEMKATLRGRFQDSEYLDKFLEILLKTGWTSLDIDSAVRQAENPDRPAVQAFLLHNEDVLDQIMLNQATYTHFQDTAADPNYAIRHPGQTELLLRRLTPGDLMMLNAAHLLSTTAAGNRPSEQVDNYWFPIWLRLLDQMLGAALAPAFKQVSLDPYAAASAAMDFALATDEPGGDRLNFYEINRTFMTPQSRFYCGVQATYSGPSVESRREGDTFNRVYTEKGVYRYRQVESMPESLWMLACVVLCYGVDNVARSAWLRGTSPPFYKGFIRLINDKEQLSVYERTNHVNQETTQPTSGVSTNRLLP